MGRGVNPSRPPATLPLRGTIVPIFFENREGYPFESFVPFVFGNTSLYHAAVDFIIVPTES